jgi:TRAP-type C4-dicarboxylate transport system permease small subunit
VRKVVLRAFDGLCDATSILILWSTVVVVFLQILARYVFKAPLVWTEEVARFAFIWLAFVGVAVTERQNAHFRITFLVEKAPPRLRYAIWALVELCILATLLLLFFEAVKYTEIGGHNVSAVMQLRLSYIYVSLPVFVVLAFVNRLRAIVRTIRRGTSNPFA